MFLAQPFLILFFSVFSASIPPPSFSCGDLLELYGEKPAALEFLDCKQPTAGQTIAEARYRIPGQQAEKIEQYLIESYGMGKLKFTCCGWEPEDGKLGNLENARLERLNPDYSMLISMFGNAEKTNAAGEAFIEKDRHLIDYFYVTVQVVEV